MVLDSQEMSVAREAAKQAGDVLLNYFGHKYPIQEKTTYNLVSEADLKSEALIIEIIRSSFPDHAILGEESSPASVASPDLWIVDPLDGTNNFVHGIEHFAISIAYHRGGEPQVAVVYRPTTGDWFTAARSCGAWINGSPARVNQCDALNQVLIGVGFYYDRGQQMRDTLAAIQQLFEAEIHGIRRMGTASLDLCWVGCGRFGAYFELELAPWDFAAGALFVREAGGRVTSCIGEPTAVRNGSVLASNTLLHEAMLNVLQPFNRRG